MYMCTHHHTSNQLTSDIHVLCTSDQPTSDWDWSLLSDSCTVPTLTLSQILTHSTCLLKTSKCYAPHSTHNITYVSNTTQPTTHRWYTQ